MGKWQKFYAETEIQKLQMVPDAKTTIGPTQYVLADASDFAIKVGEAFIGVTLIRGSLEFIAHGEANVPVAIATGVAAAGFVLICPVVSDILGEAVMSVREAMNNKPAQRPRIEEWVQDVSRDKHSKLLRIFRPPLMPSGEPVSDDHIVEVAQAYLSGTPFSERAMTAATHISGPAFRVLQDDFVDRAYAKHFGKAVKLTDHGETMMNKIARSWEE